MRRSDQDWKKVWRKLTILFQVQDWPLQLLRLFSSMWPCSCLITLQYTDGALVGKPIRCLHAASPLYSSASAKFPFSFASTPSILGVFATIDLIRCRAKPL